MPKYKIWITVEEIDEANDQYQDVGLPDSVGVYDTYDEARDVLLNILGTFAPDAIQDSDHRKV